MSVVELTRLIVVASQTLDIGVAYESNIKTHILLACPRYQDKAVHLVSYLRLDEHSLDLRSLRLMDTLRGVRH